MIQPSTCERVALTVSGHVANGCADNMSGRSEVPQPADPLCATASQQRWAIRRHYVAGKGRSRSFAAWRASDLKLKSGGQNSIRSFATSTRPESISSPLRPTACYHRCHPRVRSRCDSTTVLTLARSAIFPIVFQGYAPRGLPGDTRLLSGSHRLPATVIDHPLHPVLERGGFCDEQIGAFRKLSDSIAGASITGKHDHAVGHFKTIGVGLVLAGVPSVMRRVPAFGAPVVCAATLCVSAIMTNAAKLERRNEQNFCIYFCPFDPCCGYSSSRSLLFPAFNF